MSTVYNVGEFDESEEGTREARVEVLQAQNRPDGTPVYTPLTGVTLMVFYVFALQCVSTVAIVRRETNPGSGRSSSGSTWPRWRGCWRS